MNYHVFTTLVELFETSYTNLIALQPHLGHFSCYAECYLDLFT